MATAADMYERLNNICRICLKESDEMSPIFEDSINTNNLTVLANKITSIAQVEISPTDGLPTSICEMCRRQVDQFHEFRLLVEISDKTLRSCFEDRDKIVKTEPLEDRSVSENQPSDMLLESSETATKNPSNYALLVSTASGLQLWKISDAEQNKIFDRIKIDSTAPTNKQLPVNIPNRSKTRIVINKPLDDPIHFRQFPDTNNDRIVTKESEGSNDFEELPIIHEIKCELCSNLFESVDELKDHIAEHCFLNEAEDYSNPSSSQNKEYHESEDEIENISDENIEFDIQNESQNSLKESTEGCYTNNERFKVKRRIGPLLYKCKICEKVFTKTALKKHLEKCQPGEGPLDCSECGKQFSKKSELRYHKGTHLSSPLTCTTCDNKNFRNLQSFKMHMKRHTLGSRYNCNKCEKSYYTNSELARHVQQHLGRRKFPCHLCDTSFLSKPELNRHLKYHNGVKRFECNLCYKSYYESGHLKVHLRVHTGERPFVCTICNKGFVTRSKLVRHTKIHKE